MENSEEAKRLSDLTEKRNRYQKLEERIAMQAAFMVEKWRIQSTCVTNDMWIELKEMTELECELRKEILDESKKGGES